MDTVPAQTSPLTRAPERSGAGQERRIVTDDATNPTPESVICMWSTIMARC